MTKKYLVTFDIDGTMLDFGGMNLNHPRAFLQAFQEVFGVDAGKPGFFTENLDGWMDTKIAKWMIEKIGKEATEEVTKNFQTRVEDIYDQTADTEKPNLLPGVACLLEKLNEMPNVCLGVASGNYPRIGWKKLQIAGIDQYFPDRIGAFGNNYERHEALSKAKELAENLHQCKFDYCIHVGDTPIDVTAAKKAGFIAVAVRTGNTKLAFPDACYILNNLEEGYDRFLRFVTEDHPNGYEK